MKKVSTYLLVALFVIGLGVVSLANDDTGANKDKPKIAVQTTSGKVTAIDDKVITIQTTSDTPEDITFNLEGSTIKASDFPVGTQITIEYKDDSGKKTITQIKRVK